VPAQARAGSDFSSTAIPAGCGGRAPERVGARGCTWSTTTARSKPN